MADTKKDGIRQTDAFADADNQQKAEVKGNGAEAKVAAPAPVKKENNEEDGLIKISQGLPPQKS
jgi:hypothetical protein